MNNFNLILQIGGCFSIIGGIQTLYQGNEAIKEVCEDEPETEDCLTLFWNIGKNILPIFHARLCTLSTANTYSDNNNFQLSIFFH